ncbi:MAG: TM0996/MTH895 family glutaredoxin-like protein [Clostridiaceae bacterium]|nr:TM0996/MTH895 family glutaredoxin-like protein [Clostridiaceae bacterium]
MSLFSFGKKKEEKKAPACCCKPASGTEKAPAAECCGAPVAGICCVKVLGAGCKSCHTLYENTQAAVRSVGLAVEVEYVTDMKKIMEYGVMSMPALVVNEQVVSMGKVLKAADVEKLLRRQSGC